MRFASPRLRSLSRAGGVVYRSLWLFSLAATAALAGLWVHSYRVAQHVGVERTRTADGGTTLWRLTAARGELAASYSRTTYASPQQFEDLAELAREGNLAPARTIWGRGRSVPMPLADLLADDPAPALPGPSWSWVPRPKPPPTPPPTWPNRLGFGFKNHYAAPAVLAEPDSRRRHVVIVVPLWLAVAACCVLPARRLRLALRRRRRKSRARRGLCPACGYDVSHGSHGSHGSDGGRCPECGERLASVGPSRSDALP